MEQKKKERKKKISQEAKWPETPTTRCFLSVMRAVFYTEDAKY